jgi:diamine N-acetyltransferase
MTITLREISKDNWWAIARLSRTLTPEERGYVADNAISMLEAIYEDPDTVFARGVYDSDTPVGFTMYGQEIGRWWIIRLMTAKEHQGKGYARAAMQQVIDIIKSMPNTDAVYISFVPGNEIAQKLYASLGFVDTGEIIEGEIVYKLSFEK